MNNFREKMEQKSTEELKNILIEIEDNYGDESLNNARKKALEMIKDILIDRGVDVNSLQPEQEPQDTEVKQEEKEQLQTEKEPQQDEIQKEEYEIKQETAQEEKKTNKSSPDKTPKYDTLNFLPGFIKISAIVFFVMVIILNIISQTTLLTAVVITLFALIILIPYYALSEFITLFLDIEEHTRRTKEILEEFYKNG